MLNTEAIITKIRNIIADNTDLALTDVYSPIFPQEEKDNICAVTLLGGPPEYSLYGMQNFNITFRVLIKGTANDTATRSLADDIFNALNLQHDIEVDNNKIVQILAVTLPAYVGVDEELRYIYNITFNLKGR